jgi:hypothetical protein
MRLTNSFAESANVSRCPRGPLGFAALAIALAICACSSEGRFGTTQWSRDINQQCQSLPLQTRRLILDQGGKPQIAADPDTRSVILAYQRAEYTCSSGNSSSLDSVEGAATVSYLTNVNHVVNRVQGDTTGFAGFDANRLRLIKRALCADSTQLYVVVELLGSSGAVAQDGYVLSQGVSQGASTYFWHELQANVASMPLFDRDLSLNVVATSGGHFFRKLGVTVRRQDVLQSKQNGNCQWLVQLDRVF